MVVDPLVNEPSMFIFFMGNTTTQGKAQAHRSRASIDQLTTIIISLINAVMGTVTINLFFISHLYVEKSTRNKGIGAKLLSAIEQSGIESGCNIIRLNTFNKKSHAFYLKSGYTETICIKGYMNDFDLVYYHKAIS